MPRPCSLATSQAATNDRVRERCSVPQDPHSLVREGPYFRTGGAGQGSRYCEVGAGATGGKTELSGISILTVLTLTVRKKILQVADRAFPWYLKADPKDKEQEQKVVCAAPRLDTKLHPQAVTQARTCGFRDPAAPCPHTSSCGAQHDCLCCPAKTSLSKTWPTRGQQILHTLQEVAARSDLSLNYKKSVLLRSPNAINQIRFLTGERMKTVTHFRARSTSPPD